MKKIIKIILSSALALSVPLIFAGCGEDSETADRNGNNRAQYNGNPKVQAELRWKSEIPLQDIDENRPVQNGDIANIDFLGMLDGVPFAGGAAEGYDLGIGSGAFIPGFEEQIVGMTVGEVRDIDITFPEEYGAADLAGQAVVFRITLNSVIPLEALEEHSGTVIIELYPEYAPLTVENFVKLVSLGFYDGLTFHRIVDGFMAQGGCPYGLGYGGSGKTIDCETIDNGWTQNTLKHTPGVISMAHSGTNTGSSQFFIMLGDAPLLDGRHAGFGKVIEGFETIEALQTVPRTYNQLDELATPIFPVIIESMKMLETSAE
ncbi:MAG: peptidylprolyl isomerase [Oscillospiraceae bacterium]|nr:peptidylprolyl isomerase [Oscillospiraceae bacterium]